MLTVFFSRARTGNIIATIFYMAMYIISMLVNGDDIGMTTRIFASLSS